MRSHLAGVALCNAPTLQDLLSKWVDEVREQTETMPPGPEQDALFKKIAQADQDQNLTIGSARRSFNRRNDSRARCFALSPTFSPIDDAEPPGSTGSTGTTQSALDDG